MHVEDSKIEGCYCPILAAFVFVSVKRIVLVTRFVDKISFAATNR